MTPEMPLAAMREWIADCSWRDLEAEDVAELTDAQVVAGVRRFYEGGVAQAAADAAPGAIILPPNGRMPS